MRDVGAAIQRAWRAWVRQNVNAAEWRRELASIEWSDRGDDDVYLYVVVGRDDGRPVVESVQGPMAADYFQGASWSKLVAAIPLHRGMTKRDLASFEIGEDTAWWDHPAWSERP